MQRFFKPHLSWLGVAAVIAGCAVAALVQVDRPAFAQAPRQATACRAAAQGQVISSSRGQAQGWTDAALNTLCNGVETSNGPAQCFSHVMTSNSVNYGGGTAWNANNALRLCASASDAQRRISCFEGKIAQGVGWSAAIDQCVAEERTMNAQVVAPTSPRIGAVAPTGATPALTPATSNEQLQQIRRAAQQASVRMHCVGPMRVYLRATDNNDVRAPVEIRLAFRPAASATQIQPGQCWREGGWEGRALVDFEHGGDAYIIHRTNLGPCALLRSMSIEGGRVSDFVVTDTASYALLNAGFDTNALIIAASYAGRLDVASGEFQATPGGQPSHCQ